MSVRILLADDHAMFRAGIRAILGDVEGVEVVAEAANGREALALAATMAPTLVLMDISMRELNGIEATERLCAEHPGLPVLILSMHDTEEFVRRALKAGARGYLLKDCAPTELATAIDCVLHGEIYVSPKVSRHLVAGLVRGAPDGDGHSPDVLTPRQREILQLIAEGRSTKQIGFDLNLSPKTVETHRSALMERLGIRDIAGLVLYAVRHRLVDAAPLDD